MDYSFFPITWRGKAIEFSKEEQHLTIPRANLLQIERKLKEVVENFIQGIFNYEKIKVKIQKKESNNKNNVEYSSSKLVANNEHIEFSFAIKLFNDKLYEFNIQNIPATESSHHIGVFFNVVEQYLTYFYESYQKQLPYENDKLISSPSFVAKMEILLYNIERTITIEYIYNLFNTYDADYSNNTRLVANPIRYNLDLIIEILDFAYELNTKKIENKEIYCGFIFHDNEDEIISNSIRNVRFEKQFDFGNFAQLKNYLEISNGQNVFFNVTNGKVTHLLITKNTLNEIYINPIGEGKTFQRRPLILSIQGNGKIFFLEGRSDQNKIILQIVNSKLIIRDSEFIKKFIRIILSEFSEKNHEQLNMFSDWIMSLSQKKHGTSLIFYEVTPEAEKKLVKTVNIFLGDNQLFNNDNYLRHDLSILNSIVNPDGAVIFNKNLIPTHISTILPIGKSKNASSGGARHNSVANYTKQVKCIGIVISEDGPITIFKYGNKVIKF